MYHKFAQQLRGYFPSQERDGGRDWGLSREAEGHGQILNVL